MCCWSHFTNPANVDFGHCPQVSLKLTNFAARRTELLEYYGNRALNVDADTEDEDTLFEQIESFLVNELPRCTDRLI